LTLTLAVIKRAASIWFLVAGASKAAIVSEAFKDEAACLEPLKVWSHGDYLIFFSSPRICSLVGRFV
jgi:6-phosphogluconolactonase/glucosamine-6-phosphate isomerase/deaminase